MLHAGADGGATDTPEQAQHAERLGLDGIFVGDHLKPAGPYPESVVVLAAAAGVTERIQLGFGVMRLGVLMNLLSHPVLMGFVNAAAILIALSQIPALLGIPPPFFSVKLLQMRAAHSQIVIRDWCQKALERPLRRGPQRLRLLHREPIH